MNKRKLSDSTQQRKAEKEQIQRVSMLLNIPDLRENPTLQFKSDASVTIKPDFYSESAGVIGEIHTHYGKMRVGQRHKLAADILKMLLFEEDLKKELKKYIIVCSEAEKRYLEGNSYIAKAVKMHHINVVYIPLDAEREEKVRKAMLDEDLRSQ